ncbi:hypothetical protein [Isoptericola chiayiensis]|uniref:hypothetical protein n=1 Tax=Isoptericola chiayiensis TaxID=579446 RepID=UPI001C12BC94|nr:hypothetical protein [Isoptericola chiayiensis]
MTLRPFAVLVVTVLAGCQATDADDPAGATSAAVDEQRFPDVLEATVECEGTNCDLEVTISSPYDTPARYADGWRVLTTDGTELGVHDLAHDHAGEQPFTRTQRDLEIPSHVEVVVVEARDLEHGYGGGTVTVTLPDR